MCIKPLPPHTRTNSTILQSCAPLFKLQDPEGRDHVDFQSHWDEEKCTWYHGTLKDVK
jgi:hypothetical protein